jgi:predicted  nucleic acid-binding Zn-ribbon protein
MVEVHEDPKKASAPPGKPPAFTGRSDEYAYPEEVPTKITTLSVPPPPGRRFSDSFSATNTNNASEARELAAYGFPPDGLLGAAFYFLKVRKRRLELLEEQRRRTAEATAADTHQRKLLSRLAQEANRAGMCPAELGPSIEQAKQFSQEQVEARTKAEELEVEHKLQIDHLEKERSGIDDICQPLREEQELVKAELDKLAKAKRGIEVHKKRAEIELRNIEDGIARKQQTYADPGKSREEKDALLREISVLDNQRPELLTRLRSHEKEIETLAAPLAEAEVKLEEVGGKLDDLGERRSQLDAEIGRLGEKFSKAVSLASEEMERATEKADELWAKVGRRLLSDKIDAPSLSETLALVKAASQEAMASQNRRLIIDLAVNSYDKPVFDKGKKLFVGACAAAVLLVVLVLVFLAT